MCLGTDRTDTTVYTTPYTTYTSGDGIPVDLGVTDLRGLGRH